VGDVPATAGQEITMSKFQEDPTTDDGVTRAGASSIERFMSDSIAMVSPSTSIRDAAERLQVAEVGLVVVGTPDAVEGVVSERDIVRCVALGTDLDATSVETIESDHLKWATVDSTVDTVAEEMMENYVRHMLVADDAGRLVGVVSMRDLFTAYLA
jgi:CBS domain-containing protein